MADTLASAGITQQLTHGADARAVRALLPDGQVTAGFAGSGWAIALVLDPAGASTAAPAAAPFTVVAPDAVWDRLLQSSPEPGWQSLLHLVRTGVVVVEGDTRAFYRHLHLVRALIESGRGGRSEASAHPRPLTAVGSYLRVASALGVADIHVERCGQGPQLLALATAGSDTTQWHGLMTDSDIIERYELITVDLPWHGRSSPTFGEYPGEWRLTPADYTDFIVAAADAIGLERPTLVGASMAGAAVVHAVATHPTRFAGAVACQAGERVSNRASELLAATDIDQTLLVPEWTVGLMNPASPRDFRTRVWWGYSRGGHGTYAADIASYLQWDLDEVVASFDERTPHIAVLSGSYDTTVTPDDSRRLAARIPNSSFVEMPELGHFPHAENPALFAEYLDAALIRVRDQHPSVLQTALERSR